MEGLAVARGRTFHHAQAGRHAVRLQVIDNSAARSAPQSCAKRVPQCKRYFEKTSHAPRAGGAKLQLGAPVTCSARVSARDRAKLQLCTPTRAARAAEQSSSFALRRGHGPARAQPSFARVRHTCLARRRTIARRPARARFAPRAARTIGRTAHRHVVTRGEKPMVGLEPTTPALRKPCSAIELHRHRRPTRRLTGRLDTTGVGIKWRAAERARSLRCNRRISAEDAASTGREPSGEAIGAEIPANSLAGTALTRYNQVEERSR